MSQTVIQVDNLSKAYQLGQFGTGTLSRDLERFWTVRIRGKEDPFLRIGEKNDRSVKGKSDIVWSLRDINFQVEQGQAVGIIGKNGAGKSTLLKLLSRVTGPTAGEIKVRGRIASLLEVGTGFHPQLTGRENIYLNGAILGMRKKEITRKLDEIIDFSGVERYVDTPVKRYSSGMYVRLAFAVAAHLESEILIVDEVLAVGDAEFRNKCIGKMQEISGGQGRTVLFVSHDMSAIMASCSRGILMQHGQIAYDGNIFDCIQEYVSANREGLLEEADLSKRRGTGRVRVSNLNFHGERIIKAGDEVQITIEFAQPLSPSEYEGTGVFLVFSNSMKKKVMTISNKYIMAPTAFDKVSAVTFTIASFPLADGVYSIDMLTYYNGALADGVDEVMSFEVMGSDFYKTGYMPNPSKHGEYLVSHSAEIR